MNTDKELLELAAKAAGMAIYWDYRREQFFHDYHDGIPDEWNPLTDDGDALRLIVKLKIPMQFPGWKDVTRTWGDEMHMETFDEPHDADPYAATRRAIVRAAAAIGKEMKP